MMGRKLAHIGLTVAACVMMAAGIARAQDPSDVRVGITYTPGYLPGLVMTPVESGGTLAVAAVQVDSILRRDLDYADRFQIVPVPDDLPTEGPVNYGLWNQLGAQPARRRVLRAQRGQGLLVAATRGFGLQDGGPPDLR